MRPLVRPPLRTRFVGVSLCQQFPSIGILRPASKASTLLAFVLFLEPIVGRHELLVPRERCVACPDLRSQAAKAWHHAIPLMLD